MNILGEAVAEEAETAVAMIHRQRGNSKRNGSDWMNVLMPFLLSSLFSLLQCLAVVNGKGLTSSRSSVSLPSVTLGRKRSLPSLLLPPSSQASAPVQVSLSRRPSVPCPVVKKPSVGGIDGDVADCDLMAIKGRLMSSNTKQ